MKAAAMATQRTCRLHRRALMAASSSQSPLPPAPDGRCGQELSGLHSTAQRGREVTFSPRAARLTIPLNRGMAAMAKSDLLRFQDVRDAYRLIGECRDLGGDPDSWQRRMLEGLCRLIGAPAAAGGEGRVGAISVFDTGFDPSGHERLMAYTHDLAPRADPILSALQRVPGRLATRTRRQLVSNAVWYRSATFNDYHRPASLDDQLTSIYQVSERGAISLISL